MSINVTVNGNPISVRRGKMVLSDLENIKKSEREHRRRLRLEQVQEQSKAFSKRMLERAKRIGQEELSRLQNEDSKIKRAHNKRLMEYHRRFQDIENIGYAHENAAKQPDIEMIKQAEEERNKALARARGADAIQRLQETQKAVSPRSKQHERLQAVRDIENERSWMVAQLPKKPAVENNSFQFSENDSISKTIPSSSTKKRAKCVIHKRTPVRKLSKQKIRSSTSKSPSRVSVAVHSEESNKKPPTSISSSMDKNKNDSPDKSCNVPTTISGPTSSSTNQETKRVQVCESDDNEPRRIVPSSSEKPEKLPKCHDNSSSTDLSSTSVSSSSISDSSSFTGNTSKVTTIRKTPRHVTPVDSKVHLYDHTTRQRNVYNTPSGLVERMNIKNKPNADDLAREVTELENRELEMLASQQNNSKQRSKDAILRDKIRRDYEALVKNLDLLTKEERRIKASQVANAAQIPAPSKKREDDVKRQKKMDRAFQTILRSTQKPNPYNSQTERPITITPRDYLHEPTPTTAWREETYNDDQVNGEAYSEVEDENQNAHKGMICDLLLKIERLKKKLLQEYGTELPDTVFNASVRSLFNQTAGSTGQVSASCNGLNPKTPEIQVINMSGNEEACKSVRKFTTNNNNKNKKGRPQTPGKALTKTSTASTSTSTGSSGNGNVNTRDQQVQVELIEKEKSKEEVEKPRHPIEPVVTVITPENADSNSSISSANSSSTDVLIDVSKKGITVVPKESSRKISKEALATPATKASRHPATTPMKISFEPENGNSSFQVGGLIIDAEKKEITVLTKKRKTPKSSTRMESPADSDRSHSLPGSRSNSPVAHLPKSAPSSRHTSPKKPQNQTAAPTQSPSTECPPPSQQKRYRTQITQVTIDSSTESSQLNSTSDASNGALYTRFTAMSHTFSKVPDTSDASTTYRSPPAAVAGSLLHAINGSTPILELLDSSSNESLRRRARDVSPVSSPETPSPRTVLLPSNRPKPGMPIRRLKFNSLLADKQVKPSGERGAGDPKAARVKEVPTRDKSTPSFTPVHSSTILTKTNSQTQTSRTCTCSDPGCRLFHEKVEDTQAYALKHWPEIVKKYEDLQNVCSERIVSLTDLIQKVRNEQKGLELSMVTNEESKSNSASQMMPTSQSSSAGGNVSRLVQNIESIHARLKRTLVESQKIIAGEGMEVSTPYASFREAEKSPCSSIDFSKELSSIESVEEYMRLEQNCRKSPLAGVAVVPVPCAKPKIIKDERVTISLNRFRPGQGSRLSGGAAQTEKPTSDTGAPSKTVVDPAPSATDQSEVLVEMLSKEILEQSKSINKSVPPDSLKDSDDSILKTSQAHVTKDSTESNKNANSNDDINQSDNLETSYSDFVPFLAGIPKISRPLTKGASNGRARPPVTLISGPYRPETLVSPAHELSTIVEFDTPDTANKSQVSTRSPSNKCRKKLLSGNANSGASSPSKKDLIATKSKPSVQVAPLPTHRSPQFPHNISSKAVFKNTDKSPRKSINKLEHLERRRTIVGEPKKSDSSESMHSLPDMHIEQLQQSNDNGDSNYEFRISQISELQSLPDENIDQMIISEICEESKSKTITPTHKLSNEQELDRGQLSSTSSASFSGLSGVSEITKTPESDLNLFKCPSSPEEMELALKKWGLGWAIPTWKKTREASALGSSSSSDVTPVNTVARLVSPAKKHHDSTPRDLPEISDVSSISIKHTNKSTEKSVLVRGRTSTPNRLIDNSNNSNNNSNNYSDNQSNNYSNNRSNNRSNIHSNNDSDHTNDRSIHTNDRSIHTNDRSIHTNDRSNHSNDRSNHSNDRSDHLSDRSNHSNDRPNRPSSVHSNIPSNFHSNIPSNLHSNIPLNIHSSIPSVDDPNIPSKDHPITPANDRSNISTNVHPVVPSNDHSDNHSSIHPQIRSNSRSSTDSSNHSKDSNNPQNIPTNVPSSVHPITSSSIPSNISSGVHPNILSNIPSNIYPNIFSNISSNIHSNTLSNVHPIIPSNIPPSIQSTIPSDVHPNISSNVYVNVPSNIPSNIPSSTQSNIPSSIQSNIPSSIQSNIPSSIQSNIPSNIQSYIPSSIQSNIPSSIQSNIPSNIPSSIQSNIPSSVQSNIPSNIPLSIQSNIPLDVRPNISLNAYPNVPSNISSDVHPNISSGVYPNIPSNNYPNFTSNDRSNDYPNYRLSDYPNNQSNQRSYRSNDYPIYRLSDHPSIQSNNRSNNNSNDHSNDYTSDGTISTLGSFSSDFNIVVPNQSSDISIPNISFTNKLG